MLFKFPKNDSKYYWTSHSKTKMLQYRISEQKIKTILKNPSRKEEGIAPKTIAVMMRNDTPKRKSEVWVMYQSVVNNEKKSFSASRRIRTRKTKKIKIISTWKYPGISPKNKEIFIPEDALEELTKIT